MRSSEQPFFSICVPQYNRTAHLIEACRALAAQRFRDFELCISDDCSTDGREAELLAFLDGSGLAYTHRRTPRNLRYDANLRAAIGLARGRYCLLMGNDDALSGPDALAELHAALRDHGPAAVAITNYADYASGAPTRRVGPTGLQGAGPQAAARSFRNLSFVSGVVLERTRAQALATARWDGSEMYQMYLACRMLAEGGALLSVGACLVRKDIQIAGEVVDSVSRRPRAPRWPIVERRLTLDQLGRLVVDAIAPHTAPRERQQHAERVLAQIFSFTYPYWLFRYRRIQSWSYALGVCLGMRPARSLQGVELRPAQRLRLTALFHLVSALGLLAPVGLFERLYPWAHAVAKAYRAGR